jgi:hypothetical protein
VPIKGSEPETAGERGRKFHAVVRFMDCWLIFYLIAKPRSTQALCLRVLRTLRDCAKRMHDRILGFSELTGVAMGADFGYVICRTWQLFFPH